MTYNEKSFKHLIAESLEHTSALFENIRHYKMSLMDTLVRNSIRINEKGNMSLSSACTTETVTMGEIIIGDGIAAGPESMSWYEDHFRSEGAPLIEESFLEDQRFQAGKYRYADPEILTAQSNYSVIGGDILMIRQGARRGSCTVLPLFHPDSMLGAGCFRARINHARYDVFFIINVLHYYFYKNVFSLGASDALSLDFLLSLPIPDFPLDKQKSIASSMLELSGFMVAQETYAGAMRKLEGLVKAGCDIL